MIEGKRNRIKSNLLFRIEHLKKVYYLSVQECRQENEIRSCPRKLRFHSGCSCKSPCRKVLKFSPEKLTIHCSLTVIKRMEKHVRVLIRLTILQKGKRSFDFNLQNLVSVEFAVRAVVGKPVSRFIRWLRKYLHCDCLRAGQIIVNF